MSDLTSENTAAHVCNSSQQRSKMHAIQPRIEGQEITCQKHGLEKEVFLIAYIIMKVNIRHYLLKTPKDEKHLKA